MARTLLIYGAALFLLGLLQGGLVQLHLNPRMALSAHLTALQSGMALMIAGIAWPAVSLPVRWGGATRMGLIAGMFGLWIALTLAALTGASAMLPIAGSGYAAGSVMETVVSILILASSGLVIVSWAALLFGLCRRAVR